MMNLTSAYIYGYQAYQKKDNIGCPYDQCSAEEAEWYKGWYDAVFDSESDRGEYYE